jgi:hypothetical protein
VKKVIMDMGEKGKRYYLRYHNLNIINIVYYLKYLFFIKIILLDYKKFIIYNSIWVKAGVN